MHDEIHGIEPGFHGVDEECDHVQPPDDTNMTRGEAERITRTFLLRCWGEIDEQAVQQIVTLAGFEQPT